MSRCGDCRYFHASVHKQDRTWFGSCVLTRRGWDRLTSGHGGCSRFEHTDGRPGSFPLHGPRVRDGCEWSPEDGGPAFEGDRHHSSAPAEVLVGAKGEWRLCADCAAGPAFTRYRVRRPVRKLPEAS